MPFTIVELGGIAGGIAATVMAVVLVVNLIRSIKADKRDSTAEAHKGAIDAGIKEGTLNTQIAHIINSLSKLTITVDGLVKEVSALRGSAKALEAHSRRGKKGSDKTLKAHSSRGKNMNKKEEFRNACRMVFWR